MAQPKTKQIDLNDEDHKKQLGKKIETIIEANQRNLIKPTKRSKNYQSKMKSYNQDIEKDNKKTVKAIQDFVKRSTGVKLSKDDITNDKTFGNTTNNRNQKIEALINRTAEKYNATTRLQKAKKALSEAAKEIKAVLKKFNMTDKGQTKITTKEAGATAKSATQERGNTLG